MKKCVGVIFPRTKPFFHGEKFAEKFTHCNHSSRMIPQTNAHLSIQIYLGGNCSAWSKSTTKEQNSLVSQFNQVSFKILLI